MSSEKKRKPFDLKNWLIPRLRRISYEWPARKEAKNAARIERGKYKCASCKNIFGPKEISLDHDEPVIDPIDGFVNWDVYIKRLFTDVQGWNVLCHNCHDEKTKQEQDVRVETRKYKKSLTHLEKDDINKGDENNG